MQLHTKLHWCFTFEIRLISKILINQVPNNVIKSDLDSIEKKDYALHGININQRWRGMTQNMLTYNTLKTKIWITTAEPKDMLAHHLNIVKDCFGLGLTFFRHSLG